MSRGGDTHLARQQSLPHMETSHTHQIDSEELVGWGKSGGQMSGRQAVNEGGTSALATASRTQARV